MRIQLPNGEKITLDEDVGLHRKLMTVNNLIAEWADEIESNWDSLTIRFFLNNLADYLVWHKEEEDKGNEDKEVLSVRKVEEMNGKRKNRSIPISSLSKPQRESLGFEGDINE